MGDLAAACGSIHAEKTFSAPFYNDKALCDLRWRSTAQVQPRRGANGATAYEGPDGGGFLKALATRVECGCLVLDVRWKRTSIMRIRMSVYGVCEGV